MSKDDTTSHAPRSKPAAVEERPALPSRRRLGKAGLAAPVLMTLASRPVWATGRQCTVSALASFRANDSRPVNLETCQACSPGYWNLERCWPDGFHPTDPFHATFGYTLSNYNLLLQEEQDGNLEVNDGQPTYQDIVNVLQTPLADFFPPAAGTDLFKACRAVTAAALNAAHPNVPFALTMSFVLGELQRVFPGPSPQEDMMIDPEAPTAGNSELLSLASSLAAYWDELSDECILPGNGDCPSPP